MKIEYRRVGVGGSYTLLADASAGGVIKDWRPKASLGSSQKENLAVAPGQSGSQYRQPLGNFTTHLSLEVVVTYGSREEAMTAARTTTTNLLGGKNNFKVTEGAEIQYYGNGLIENIDPNVQGSTIVFTFTVECDLVSTSEPS